MNLKKLLMTFLFVFGLLTLVACGHEHAFDKEVVEEQYLASAATCTEKAKYYKSCDCGEKGTETFESGELAAHVFDKEVAEEKYLAEAATTEAPAKYYKSCVCGEKGTETFESGDVVVVTVSNIADVVAAENGAFTVKGTVVALYAQGFLVKDATGLILVYKGSAWEADVVAGDVVTVAGNTTEYGAAKQFGTDATYTKEGTAAVELGEAKELTVEELNAYKDAKVTPLYASFEGVLTVSGKYYNVALEGAEVTGSISYPVDAEALKALDGKNVKFTGFIIGFTGGKYVNMMVTAFEEKTLAPVLAGGSEGAVFNYKYADLETRSSILAALEKWLLNVGYSAPLYSSISYTLFADRVTPLCSEYVPSMGFGTLYGSVSTGSCAGTEADPAYRSWTSASPKTLNDMMYADSAESDILAFNLDALFVIDFNENKDGFKMYPSMAEKLAEPVEFVDGQYKVIDTKGDENYLSKKWLITIRKDLVFSNYKGEKVANITAADFIYKYQQLLDPKQVNERADDCFFNSSFRVVNAEEYFKGEITDWAQVGIKQVDDYSFVFECENEYNSWDFHYYTGSFILGPLHKETYEATLTESDGKVVSSYGTVAGMTDFAKTDMILYTGPYLLTYYEQDKEYRMAKNPNWKQNSAIPYAYNFDQLSTVIVKDSNAAFELWEQGKLDAISIPSAKLDEYIDNPAIKKAPGGTVFRFNVNAMSQEQLQEKFGLTEEDWKANPLLQTKEFRQALFYAINRDEICSTVDKSRQAEVTYVNDAYVIMQGTAGTIYRQTEAGQAVKEMTGEDEIQMGETTNGYNGEMAKDLYVKALTQLVNDGVISDSEEVELTLEIALFDGDTMEKLGAYLVEKWNALFNEQTTFPNVKLTVSYVACPGMDVYYAKQMLGKFDIGIGGISGSSLDPLGYMDVFFDDPSNSLQLTWGIDTNVVEIEWNGMLWSFEALTQAASGKTFIKDGDNAAAQEYNDMISACTELINAAAEAKELAADAEKVVAALEALNNATGIQDGYDKALAACKDILGLDDAATVAELVKLAKEKLVPAYAEYVKVLLKDDYDYVKVEYIDKYSEEVLIANGYQSYIDFYKTGYEAAVKEGGAVDTKTAELVAAFAAESFGDLVKAYAAAQAALYEFYLW